MSCKGCQLFKLARSCCIILANQILASCLARICKLTCNLARLRDIIQLLASSCKNLQHFACSFCMGYNITDCPTTESDCGSNIFLRVKDDNNETLIEDNLNSSDRFRVKQFHFDLSPNQTENFRLLLVSTPGSGCITVSRVLVYRNECPGHERDPGGLVRRPSVQAPVSGSVPVISSYCAENANHTELSQPQDLVCTAEGKWLNDGINCQCNKGYYKDGTVCRGMFYSIEHWCH